MNWPVCGRATATDSMRTCTPENLGGKNGSSPPFSTFLLVAGFLFYSRLCVPEHGNLRITSPIDYHVIPFPLRSLNRGCTLCRSFYKRAGKVLRKHPMLSHSRRRWMSPPSPSLRATEWQSITIQPFNHYLLLTHSWLIQRQYIETSSFARYFDHIPINFT